MTIHQILCDYRLEYFIARVYSYEHSMRIPSNVKPLIPVS